MTAFANDAFAGLFGDTRGFPFAPADDQLVAPESAVHYPTDRIVVRQMLRRLHKAGALAPNRLHEYHGDQLLVVLDGPALRARDGAVHRVNIGYRISGRFSADSWVIHTRQHGAAKPEVLYSENARMLGTAFTRAADLCTDLVGQGTVERLGHVEPPAVVYHSEWFDRAFAANILSWPLR